jgi:hypothetical protein
MLYLCELRLEEKKKFNEIRREDLQGDSEGNRDTFRDSKEGM